MLLEPYGLLIEGEPGASASRIAEELDVSRRLVTKLATPVGVMQMPYRSEFDVYSPELVTTLAGHPDVIKARGRRERASLGAMTAADTRRFQCVEVLAAHRPDLLPVYAALVAALWNPGVDRALRTDSRYSELPAMLWDALNPIEGRHDEAKVIIVDVVRTMTMERTWKVDREAQEQHAPLVWRIWEESVSVEQDVEVYRNVFAAAIRHVYFPAVRPKSEGREMALARLAEISRRFDAKSRAD